MLIFQLYGGSMDNFSSKTVGLFTGADALSKSLKQTIEHEQMMKSVMETLNSIYYPDLYKTIEETAKIALDAISPTLVDFTKDIKNIYDSLNLPVPELISVAQIDSSAWENPYEIFHIHDKNLPEQDQEEEIQASQKILSEILLPESKKIITPDSPIITVAPINDEVLCYLKENPEEWFKLTGGQFEMVMQEIYSRLGYQVERTKATRDGGKDLIIRKNESVGDLIYYVECKKYAPNRPIGVGIVREFKCTIDTDSVNGGIIATTSHFAKGARDFILNNNFDCKVKMHDGAVIKRLLNQVC